MQNPSDEELDDRMKQAGEFQDYTYDEASWQNVKARLDSTADSALWIKPTRIIPAIALLSVLLLGTWMYFTSDKAEMASQNKTANIHKAQLPTSTQTESMNPANKDLNPSEKTETIRKFVKPDFSNEGVQDVQQEAFVTKQTTLISANTAQQNQAGKAVEQTEIGFDANAISSKENIEVALLSAEKQLNQPVHNRKISTGSQSEVTVLTDSIKINQDTEEVWQNDSSDVETKADEKEKVKKGLWSIELSLSPDLSAQSFSTTAGLGFNYGLALEYKLTNAIGISAGILRARKYYTAQDITYGNYTAEFAEGNCNMWDIPVQVNYYVPSNRALQVFGSLGLSSYLMSKENYTYYPYADNKTIRYSSEVQNENKEWFKVLNLSVGLQRPLGNSIFIQVEPFVKVPLGEMGAGNIAISSVGLFLNLKYQLKK